MARTRVFVTTSHISCVLMCIHARHTAQPGDRDILLVDTGERQGPMLRIIEEAASLHAWALYRNFSDEPPSGITYKPSLWKRTMRRMKELPVARAFYRVALRAFERRRDARYGRLLADLLRPFLAQGEQLVIHGHTQTHLNQLLAAQHPEAPCVFFEHGIGDYIFIVEGGRLRGPMIALFADRFSAYLRRHGIDDKGISPLPMPIPFPDVARQLLERHPDAASPDPTAAIGKPLVLVLLESVEVYEVPRRFWAAYIDHVLSALDDPHRYHFLLKPHPRASAEALRCTEDHYRALGLSFSLLDEPWQKNMAIEVLFARWADRTEHVFCLFSSACFYLSQLYMAPGIAYHSSIDFMDAFIGNAPPLFRRQLEAVKPLVKEVFSERCLPY